MPRPSATPQGQPRVVGHGARKGARVPDGAGEALLLNVGLSGETEHLRYFAGVQNLLDVQYALPVGREFPQPVVPQYGRTFSVSLTGVY